MTRIRITFFTGSDDFSSEFELDDARRWVQSRTGRPSIITEPDGTTRQGETAATASPDDLAKWMGAIALSEAKSGKALNVRERHGKWVAIEPTMVQAVGAQVHEVDEADDADEENDWPLMSADDLFGPTIVH